MPNAVIILAELTHASAAVMYYTLQAHTDAREACASQCWPTDHNCILCFLWYLSILKCVFLYVEKSLAQNSSSSSNFYAFCEGKI